MVYRWDSFPRARWKVLKEMYNFIYGVNRLKKRKKKQHTLGILKVKRLEWSFNISSLHCCIMLKRKYLKDCGVFQDKFLYWVNFRDNKQRQITKLRTCPSVFWKKKEKIQATDNQGERHHDFKHLFGPWTFMNLKRF